MLAGISRPPVALLLLALRQLSRLASQPRHHPTTGSIRRSNSFESSATPLQPNSAPQARRASSSNSRGARTFSTSATPASTTTMAPSTRLVPSILTWIHSLAPTLPSLSDLDVATGKPRRVVESLADLRDGVVLGEIVGEV